MTLDWYCLSEKGNREDNEDSCSAFSTNHGFFAIVADGLGAHGGGKLASTIAIDSLRKSFENCDNQPVYPNDYLSAFQAANDEICLAQKETSALSDMRTTLVLLHVFDNQAVWLHCGDSRLYHIRNRLIVTITLDHSVAQMLVSEGEIEHKDITSQPDRNRLTRSMGGHNNESRPRIVREVRTLQQGDRLLLCTDGWWEHIDESELREENDTRTSKDWVSSMIPDDIDSSVKRSDNRTAIGVIIAK